jgi:hypothetical protein
MKLIYMVMHRIEKRRGEEVRGRRGEGEKGRRGD